MKQVSNKTVVRHLRAIAARMEDNDFTTKAEDKALRRAIDLLDADTAREKKADTAREKKKRDITVFVGCDLQGDHCLYVQEDDKYLTSHQLDTIVGEIEDLINEYIYVPADDDDGGDEDDDGETNYFGSDGVVKERL